MAKQVQAYRVCACMPARDDAYMCYASTRVRWEERTYTPRVSCVQGFWEEDDEEKCKNTPYWQGGRCVLFHSMNAPLLVAVLVNCWLLCRMYWRYWIDEMYRAK